MTLSEICEKYKEEISLFLQGHDMSDDMFQDVYEYYFDRMPYGVRKARDGDPYEWVYEAFDQDVYCELELNFNE